MKNSSKNKYELIPMWIELKKVSKSPVYDLTPLWNELKLCSKDPDSIIGSNALLYQRVLTFIANGSMGFMYELKAIFGEKGIDIFIKFVKDFISLEDVPGHYFLTNSTRKNLAVLKQDHKSLNLEKSLNEVSQLQYSIHGDNEAEGWRPKKMSISEQKLSKIELAKALGVSPTTLWRILKSNESKAKKNKMPKCPKHKNYTGGRYYYLLSEVQEWLDYVAQA
ncbi:MULTISPECIES: helix-turn-helix transcriptional regulator [Lactobacillus]|jgi:predicted DNA-binding transcriptional regulator AlpA|nr:MULTISPECIES: helix-turn-helix domain-containing protein [Lactobacillus]MCT3541304.1 DNA-binding protein [Lactobacillus crispatus]MCT3595196.1 DNA-binding protein [Lactobacillus amylovorus]